MQFAFLLFLFVTFDIMQAPEHSKQWKASWRPETMVVTKMIWCHVFITKLEPVIPFPTEDENQM